MFSSTKVVICLTIALSLSILSVAQPNRKLTIPLKLDSKSDPTTKPNSEPVSIDDNLFSELDAITKLAITSKPAKAPAAQPSSKPKTNTTKPNQHTKPATAPSSPPKPASPPNQTAGSDPKSKPTPKSESGKKPGSEKPPSPKPAPPQKPPAKSEPKKKPGSGKSPTKEPTSKTQPKSPESDDEVPIKLNPPSIFPYQTVNNFCLYKRLQVNRPFCLKTLKNPKAAEASNYTPLLQVTVEALSNHITKTLDDFQALKLVLADAIQESAIAGLDGQVIGEDINRCVKAVSKITDADIHESNKISKEYAKLLSDIADNSEL